MRIELKHISILIPTLLLSVIILVVPQPDYRVILLPAQSDESFKQPITTEEIKEMWKIIEKSEAELLNESNIQTDNNLIPIYKGTKEGVYRSVVLTGKFMLQMW